VYASGWAASGARGVLASTMLDAYAVADAILGDSHTGEAGAGGGRTTRSLRTERSIWESVPREVEEACGRGV